MLNFQITIIFCVLFAAIWVQSSKAFDDEDYEQIECLKNALTRVNNNKTLIPEDCIDHLKSFAHWPNISVDEKMSITINYENKLIRAKLSFNSGIDETSKDIMATLAYEALNEYVMDELEDIRGHFANSKPILDGINDVVQKGQFLDFVAYYSTMSNSRFVQEAAASRTNLPCKRSQKIYVILPPFLSMKGYQGANQN